MNVNGNSNGAPQKDALETLRAAIEQKFNGFANNASDDDNDLTFLQNNTVVLPTQQEPLLWVNQGEKQEVLARAGALNIITGRAKTGKSSVLGALLAGAVRHKTDLVVDTLGIEVAPCPPDKVVVHIDTENSDYDYKRQLLNALQRTSHGNKRPDWLLTANMRKAPIAKRMAVFERLLHDALSGGKKIHLIFLDGFTDLLPSVNDEATAIGFCERFVQLADEHQTAIVGVIHENQKITSGGGARGWFGSQMERKISAHLAVTVENETRQRSIQLLNCRGCGDIAPRLIEFDDDLMRFVSAGVGQIKVAHRPLKFDKNQIDEMKIMRENGHSYRQIALQFDTSHHTVKKCIIN